MKRRNKRMSLVTFRMLQRVCRECAETSGTRALGPCLLAGAETFGDLSSGGQAALEQSLQGRTQNEESEQRRRSEELGDFKSF